MRRIVFALLVTIASVSPSWAANLSLSIRDGLVSLDAQDVTVRQILTEWARIGRTQILNVERLTGGPMTLKLEGVPEKQALDIILRAIPGYMALPRAAQVADASLYERILIMPTTTAVAALRPQQPAPAPAFPGMQGGLPGGANVTQLRPGPGALFPGMLADQPEAGDPLDDPAIAAAAAAGLVPVPAFTPGQSPFQGPLMPPGAPISPQPAVAAPGTGAPTNPWNAPVGTAQPSLAPPVLPGQPPPTSRVRPPQADR